MQAGAFQQALDLLETSRRGPLDKLGQARVDLLRGQIAFTSGMGSDAPPLLLEAARQFEPLDLDLARETYLGAWIATLFAGRLAGSRDLLEVSLAARQLPPPAGPTRTVDLALDGLTLMITDGPAAAAPVLRRAVDAFVAADLTAEDAFRWSWQAQAAASALARTRLMYGEWLRRHHRRLEARAQLKTAHDMLSAFGADGFAERARRELTATGTTARKHSPETNTALTAQEIHIAQLAVEGRTNPEIGAVLYLSPRTVEWHLRKVFTKLGITSRRQMRDALTTASVSGPPADPRHCARPA